jgi:diguanylate cyclase (GGDEF)-like protein/PAS domain S-box-containing protein
VLGHAYKVIGYLFIYRAVVVESVERPYRALERAQENLELAVRASQTGLWDWNLQTHEVSFSPSWKAQLGFEPQELSDSFATWESLLHPEDRAAAIERAQRFAADPQARHYESEFRMRHKDGSYHWILARGEKQFDAQGRPFHLLGSHTDLTERKRAEDRFQSAVRASPTAMVMVDATGRIVLTNARTEAMFGHPASALIGQPIEVLLPTAHQGHHPQLVQHFVAHASERKMGEGRDLSARRADGSTFRVEVSLTPIDGQEGRYVLASVVDLTERLQAEQRINQLIHYDALTGLPNRTLLDDRVTQAIAKAAREQQSVAVMFLDLDHFKNVNDTLGHRVGDLLLIEVGQRLREAVRESDTVARVGGDEFVMLLPEVTADGAARIATKLLHALAEPLRVDGHDLSITPSIGVALYPDDGVDFATLYQRSDTAMYRAKEEGRNEMRFFTREMQQSAERVHRLETALHQALAKGQFFLQYQPQLSMDGRELRGVEALLRWRHPEWGLVPPGEFIPVAEANGLILPLGAWVLREATRQLRAWMDAGMAPIVVAVNLSAAQFRQPQLPQMVTEVLRASEVPPECLELELTESVAMLRPEQAMATMAQLHERGIRLSIDDFGTGYSSLSLLKKFSVYKLKIDQSFVRDIATDADDRAIVSAIVQMAHSLGFVTIAEGVETPGQRDFLQAQGCDEVQGYLFSRPIDADRIPAFAQGLPSSR